jgi:hypothetical protein
MANDTQLNLAMVEYEQASSEATELAERIRDCGRAGAAGGELVKLLKAWQTARDSARASHDRVLASSTTSLRAEPRRLAKVH